MICQQAAAKCSLTTKNYIFLTSPTLNLDLASTAILQKTKKVQYSI